VIKINKIIVIGILICLLFLTGCSTYTFVCYHSDNPDHILEVKVQAFNEGEAQSFALDKCQDRLGGIVINQIDVKK